MRAETDGAVALAAADPFNLLLTQAQDQMEAMAAVEIASVEEMSRHTGRAAQRATATGRRIIANNSELSWAEMAGRQDWLASLTGMGRFEDMQSALQASWEHGWQSGRGHSRSEARSQGLTVPALSREASGGHWLERATERLGEAQEEWQGRMQAAAQMALSAELPDPPEGITNVFAWRSEQRAQIFEREANRARRRLELRGAQAASSAAARAHTEAQVTGASMMAAESPETAVWLVWVTSFGPNTCGMCAALHGTKVMIGEMFDGSRTFAKHAASSPFGSLIGPPRHPNCRCRLVVVRDGIDADHTSSMKAAAQQWAQDHDAMVPNEWNDAEMSPLAKTTSYMTAADVRAVPPSLWESAVQTFQTCILKLKAVAKKLT